MLGIFPKTHRDTYRHSDKDRQTHKTVFKQAQVQIHADRVLEMKQLHVDTQTTRSRLSITLSKVLTKNTLKPPVTHFFQLGRTYSNI